MCMWPCKIPVSGSCVCLKLHEQCKAQCQLSAALNQQVGVQCRASPTGTTSLEPVLSCCVSTWSPGQDPVLSPAQEDCPLCSQYFVTKPSDPSKPSSSSPAHCLCDTDVLLVAIHRGLLQVLSSKCK